MKNLNCGIFHGESHGVIGFHFVEQKYSCRGFISAIFLEIDVVIVGYFELNLKFSYLLTLKCFQPLNCVPF